MRQGSALVLALVVLALTVAGSTPARAAATADLITGTPFTGIAGSVGEPNPDLAIAAGPDRLLLVSNARARITDQAGVEIASALLTDFFASVRPPGANGLTDPHAVFDPDSQRFFVVASDRVNEADCRVDRTCAAVYLLAVSKTSAPATLDGASWWFYSLDRTVDFLSTAGMAVQTDNWGDFDHLAIVGDALVISSRMYRMSDEEQRGAKVRLLDKNLVLEGPDGPLPSEGTFVDLIGMRDPGFRLIVAGMLPATVVGSPPATPFLASGYNCGFEVWGVTNPLGSAPAITGKTVLTQTTCPATPDAVQPGGQPAIDVGAVGFNTVPVYQNGSLWVAQTRAFSFTSGAVPGIAWAELDVRGWPTSVVVKQSGTIAAAGVANFAPQLMVDRSNNMTMVFARSSATENPSAYYVARLAGDVPGTLRAPVPLQAGATPLNLTLAGRNRFVDYLGAAFDPDGTMWLQGQYAAAADQVTSQVINLAAAQRLTVVKQGVGGGTVTSAPAGIACPTDCTELFDLATPVTLTAMPVANSFFAGWTGDCAGSGSCELTMDGGKAATATFGLTSMFKFGLPAFATTEPVSVTANAVITVTRTGGTHAGATVAHQTVAETGSGKATAGVDYVAQSGVLTFGAGKTSLTFTVPILPDTLAEGPETVRLRLSDPQGGAALGTPAEVNLTIADNDVAGVVQFSLPTYTVTELASATTTATVVVTRTGGAASGVSVDYVISDGSATLGQDYTVPAGVTGTVTFTAGETTRSITLQILPDALVEGDETVLLSLDNVRGGATLGAVRSAVLTIKDAQAGVQFSAPTYTVSEASATAMITVVRSGPTTGSATVRYSTGDGTATAGQDYTPATGTLTFGPGIARATFNVPILNDTVVEGPETVLLVLSNPIGAALGPVSSATLTITDNDAGGTIKLGAAAFSFGEGSGNAAVTVTRSGGTAGGVTVDFTTADQPCATPPCPGKTQAALDYDETVTTLRFGPGETTKTVLVPLLNDSLVEGNETFLVRIGNPQGGGALGTPVEAVVTIVDNDQGGVIQFSSATYTVTEPAAITATATITLTRTGTNLGAASVQFATSDGTATAGLDYIATASRVVFDAGQTTKTVTVPILPDALAESNETVRLTLSDPEGGATLGTLRNAVLTIVDAPLQSVQFAADAVTVVEGGIATLTAVRGGPATGTLRVSYATANDTALAGTHYTAKSGTLTFGPGIASLPIPITTLRTVSDPVTFTATLSAPLLNNAATGVTLGARPQAAVTIVDNSPGVFEFAAAGYTANEGTSVVVTVNRTLGSAGTVLVPWSVDPADPDHQATPGTDFTPASGTLTFGAGVTKATITLAVVKDGVPENTETAVLRLGTPTNDGSLGGQDTTTLTINDVDKGGAIQFMAATATVAENVSGGKANLLLSRTGTALGGGVRVDYTITGDTGAVTSPLTGTLTFAVGQTSLTLPVSIANNAVAEADRVVVVTLSNPRSSGGATGANKPGLGATTATTLTIVDDEPRLQFSDATYSVNEGGTATITVVRTGSMLGTVSVPYATADDTAVAGNGDYTPATGTLVFGPSIARQTFQVATADDGVATGPRRVALSLGVPTGASLGARSTAGLNIQDRQSAGVIQFATASTSVVEGGIVRVMVTRTGTNLTGGVTVHWSATGGTATAVDDFAPAEGTLTFGSGVTTRSFDVTTVDDGVAEGTERIVLSLDPPTGGATLGTPSATTIYIVDAQQTVAFSTPAYTVGETVAQAVIPVVRSGVPSGTVTVHARTVTLAEAGAADPTLDFVPVTDAPLAFAPGETVKTFSVPIRTTNYLTRNGNRPFGLELFDLTGPIGVTLAATVTATATILDFRPDLVVASVALPGTTLSGKSLGAPVTIRNLGPVPAPAPFAVGVFLARNEGPASAVPGAGVLLANVSVTTPVAAGATMAVMTRIDIDDELPSGQYFVSAIANFGHRFAEADEANNGRSSDPSTIAITRNLTKFRAASASLSQTSPPAGPRPGLAGPLAVDTCDQEGDLTLAGTFFITSQRDDAASGVADLTGPFNGGVVRYQVGFNAVSDEDNNVTATLTFIDVSGRFFATGSGGTFTGQLNGQTITGTVTGTIQTFSNGLGSPQTGTCVFTGPLTAVAAKSTVLRFGNVTRPGTFGFGASPPVSFPVTPDSWLAGLQVSFDDDLPDPATVRFSGPAGTGLSNTPAEELAGSEGRGLFYITPERPGSAPGGTYTVLYKGATQTFVKPAMDLPNRFVVVYPTVTMDVDGNLTRVDWVYKDAATGVTLTAAPSYMREIKVVIELGDDEDFVSPSLFPTTTSWTLPSSKEWATVNSLSFQYTNLAGDVVVLEYHKSFRVQVQTRLENRYAYYQPGGSRERLLYAFVDVPNGSVAPQTCADTYPDFVEDPSPPVVTVYNQTGVGPFSDASTCVPLTGTTSFDDDDTGLIDIFSRWATLTGPPLAPGTVFEFNIDPKPETGVGHQRVVTFLNNPETSEAISIPNPATLALKPSGFDLAAAKLGQRQTISWTLPVTFNVREQFVSPYVSTSDTGPGQFCNVETPDLPPTATSASFTLPTTCAGLPVRQASVCIFVIGEGDEQTAACWFFQNASAPGGSVTR